MARIVLITILLLSLFITAKSFGQVGKRSYPINYYMDKIDAIQRQWTVMRYVSVASTVLSCIGIYLVSRHEKRVGDHAA